MKRLAKLWAGHNINIHPLPTLTISFLTNLEYSSLIQATLLHLRYLHQTPE